MSREFKMCHATHAIDGSCFSPGRSPVGVLSSLMDCLTDREAGLPDIMCTWQSHDPAPLGSRTASICLCNVGLISVIIAYALVVYASFLGSS